MTLANAEARNTVLDTMSAFTAKSATTPWDRQERVADHPSGVFHSDCQSAEHDDGHLSEIYAAQGIDHHVVVAGTPSGRPWSYALWGLVGVGVSTVGQQCGEEHSKYNDAHHPPGVASDRAQLGPFGMKNRSEPGRLALDLRRDGDGCGHWASLGMWVPKSTRPRVSWRYASSSDGWCGVSSSSRSP